jgi:hypothetical protein
MNDAYLPLETKELPEAPHWSKALGVGIIAMGLAIGTGELILWPHLVTKHGLGILWTALLGITFQYFINQEVARLALARGESFFTTSSRLFKWLAPFWLVAAMALYIWPGWASALGTIATEIFGIGDYKIWAWICLGIILVLTLTGKSAYQVLERFLRIIVPTFFILLVISSILTLSYKDLIAAGNGLLNFGGLPLDIDPNVLLGAIVFAGAGGLLNLCLSLWYRDKQAGMGFHAGRIVNAITGKNESVSASGFEFVINDLHLARWRRWMRFVRVDQGIIFWLLGLITLVLLSLNAYAVLSPLGVVPEGLQVASLQAKIFEAHWGFLGKEVFLIMAFLMLFSVMWTIIDAVTRIVGDTLFVNSQSGPFKKYLTPLKDFSASRLYYTLIIAIVIISAILVPLKQPLFLITLSAVLGGFAMAIYTPLIFYLSNRSLPKPIRPGIITNTFLILASVFYITFTLFIIWSNFLSKLF